MPGKKTNIKKSNTQTMTGSESVSKDKKKVKGSDPGSAHKQLRALEKRFKPDPLKENRSNIPANNQNLQGKFSKGSQLSSKKFTAAVSENTKSLIHALASARQPVLMDEPSETSEINDEKVSASIPSFLSDQYFYYSENQPAGSNIAKISLDREVDIESFQFTNTGINISDDGYYQIDDEGVISLTLLGVLSQANDCNEGTNRIQHSITLIDSSGNSCSADVIFNIVSEKQGSLKKEQQSGQWASSTGNSSGKTNINASGTMTGNILRAGSKPEKLKAKPQKRGGSKDKHLLEFSLYEYSRDKNRTRDESLILGLEHETSDRFDQLIIVSELRDRALSVAFTIKHVVTKEDKSDAFILTRIDGGSLPGWLRVNQNDGKLSGIVPGDSKNITVRVEYRCVKRKPIVRFITINLDTGEIQEVQALDSTISAGAALFTDQVQANAQAGNPDTKLLINEFNH